MREVLPGVHHWTAPHPAIGVDVSSYYLEPARVLLDPLVPPDGLAWFEDHGPPELVLLTSGLHVRASRTFAEHFGCPVRCPQAGLARHAGEDLGFELGTYAWGEELTGDIEAFEIGALCPDEAALVIPSAGAVALADGIMREGNGPLAFPPDDLLGADQADEVRRGLRAAYARLAAERAFDHLLLAHGEPWIGGGKEALQRFLAGE